MSSGVLTDRGITIETIAFDEGGELPGWRSASLLFAGWLDQAGQAAVKRAVAPGCDCQLTPKTQCLATVNTQGKRHLPNGRACGVPSQHRVTWVNIVHSRADLPGDRSDR